MKPHGSNVLRELFNTAFVCLLLLFFYSALFYTSADTPIAEATLTELLEAGALSLSLATLASILIALCCTPLWLLSRYTSIRIAPDKLLATIMIFCLALLVLENWFYSMLSVGLKSGESIILKGSFFVGAAFIAYHTRGAVFYLSHKLQHIYWPLLLALTLLPQVLVWALGPERPSLFESKARNPDGHPPLNILLLSSDGIDAEAMSIYGNSETTTPFLDSIADQLMVFENAYTNSGNTTGSITAVLTGISPLSSGVVYSPDILKGTHSTFSLPAIIGPEQHLRTQWSVPNYANAADQGMLAAFDYVHGDIQGAQDFWGQRLALSSMQIWFAAATFRDQSGVIKDVFGMEELDNPYQQVADSMEDERPKFNDNHRQDGLLRDLKRASSSSRALFSQVHFMTTHGAKFPLEKNHFSAGMEQDEPWMEPFYLDAILQFDHRLSEIYQLLEETGKLDQTLIVIYSDHGLRWSSSNRIPLLFRLPSGNHAGRYTPNVQLLDIAPTILDYLGKPIPDSMIGSSLLPAQQLAADRLIYSASVLTLKKENERVLRATEPGASFRNSNKISIIYCDQLAELYPATKKIKFLPLEGNTSPDGCTNTQGPDLAALAWQGLEQLLQAR
jgi:arylsulfatase A-like enzyme